jgi:hypothetical protein
VNIFWRRLENSDELFGLHPGGQQSLHPSADGFKLASPIYRTAERRCLISYCKGKDLPQIEKPDA